MNYTVYTTSRFERNARKFKRSYPELNDRLAEILRALAEDPYQPHLRLHPLKGAMSGMHAVRITYAFRIVLTLQITEREITLLDIGGHDDVYR